MNISAHTPLTSLAAPRPYSDRPLDFHRLSRASGKYRWWRPFAVALVALLIIGGVSVPLVVVFTILAVEFPGIEAGFQTVFADLEIVDLNDPTTFAVMMASIAVLLPVLFIATRLVGSQQVGFQSSVGGRLRWGWLLRCVGVAGALFAVAHAVVSLWSLAIGQTLTPFTASPQVLTLLGLVVLLVPFQAAAEEYVFRGYLMQALGGWCRLPMVAILVPIPLFVLGHDYELLGLIDLAVFALAAGWLTWRTGGLEAAIALHVVNNVVFCSLGAVGVVDMNATDTSLTDLVASVLLTGVYCAVIVRLANRYGVQRTWTAPGNS